MRGLIPISASAASQWLYCSEQATIASSHRIAAIGKGDHATASSVSKTNVVSLGLVQIHRSTATAVSSLHIDADFPSRADLVHVDACNNFYLGGVILNVVTRETG